MVVVRAVVVVLVVFAGSLCDGNRGGSGALGGCWDKN